MAITALGQVLVFSGILAFSRSTVDSDRFFTPIAASLLVLSTFAHLSAILAVGAIGIAVLLGVVVRRGPQMTFVGPLFLGLALAAWYYGIAPPVFLDTD